MSRWALPGVALLALGLCAGCGNKLDGDWEGTVDFLSVNGDVSVNKGSVHIHVQNDVLTVTGAPFTQCTAKVTHEGKDLKLDWSGGTCKFSGRKYVSLEKGKAPVELTVGHGAGSLSVGNGKLSARFAPSAADQASDPIDVTFDLEAHRPGK